MNETTMAVGGVLVIGLAAGAAWFVTSRAKPGGVVAKPVTPATGPNMTTMPVANNPGGLYVPGGTQQAPFQDASGAALAAELAAQRAENARREAERLEEKRQNEIGQLKNTIAAVENSQVITLTQIQSIDNDQTGLANMIRVVEAEVQKSCYDKHHGEWFDGEGQCLRKSLPDAANPAVPWSGYQRWAVEKKRLLTVPQANLARLEEQFIGLKYDLKNKYGVDYVPSPVSVPAHEYARANPGR